jgi:hypothetical protein
LHREAIQVFDFAAPSAENRYPPRIASGAGFSANCSGRHGLRRAASMPQ